MTTHARLDEQEIPLARLLEGDRACLCLITAVEGPSYRPLGAGMVVDAQGRRSGNLSSGCIEDDVVLHAQAALRHGKGKVLVYGRGSPFMDLQLPCGGRLDVTLIPDPDRALLQDIADLLAARKEARMTVTPDGRLGTDAPDGLVLDLLPHLRVLTFGTGPEASHFTQLARAVGLEAVLHSDEGTPGSVPLTAGWTADWRTAVAMFFHDHAREAELLEKALASPAFFVGAQGSARVRAAREATLSAQGVPVADIARLENPFGLVPHARDARSLAVGVLAQILDRARET